MFGWRKRIGYIAPTVIEVVGYEFYRFAPDGIGLTGVTCNIDDWRPDEFDKALAQVAAAATYLGDRSVLRRDDRDQGRDRPGWRGAVAGHRQSAAWCSAHRGRAGRRLASPVQPAGAVFPLGVSPAHKYFPPVGRIDGAYGDRNLVCSCPAPEAYA